MLRAMLSIPVEWITSANSNCDGKGWVGIHKLKLPVVKAELGCEQDRRSLHEVSDPVWL